MYSPVPKAEIAFVNAVLEWCKTEHGTVAYKLAESKVICTKHDIDMAKKQWARYIRFIDSLIEKEHE